jgi:hypothetical protein
MLAMQRLESSLRSVLRLYPLFGSMFFDGPKFEKRRLERQKGRVGSVDLFPSIPRGVVIVAFCLKGLFLRRETGISVDWTIPAVGENLS